MGCVWKLPPAVGHFGGAVVLVRHALYGYWMAAGKRLRQLGLFSEGLASSPQLQKMPSSSQNPHLGQHIMSASLGSGTYLGAGYSLVNVLRRSLLPSWSPPSSS